MADSEIKNVTKDKDGDITHVGVKGHWAWPVSDAVSSIESRTNTFYVLCPQRAEVFVAQAGASKFLKTTADTSLKNNLDNLPPL